jgi:hypothetical protein
VGVQVNTAEPVGKAGRLWRVFPNEDIAALADLKPGVAINRNRDHAWENLLSKKSAERRIGVWLALSDTADGLTLSVTDEDGCVGSASVSCEKQAPQDATQAEATPAREPGQAGQLGFLAE